MTVKTLEELVELLRKHGEHEMLLEQIIDNRHTLTPKDVPVADKH